MTSSAKNPDAKGKRLSLTLAPPVHDDLLDIVARRGLPSLNEGVRHLVRIGKKLDLEAELGGRLMILMPDGSMHELVFL